MKRETGTMVDVKWSRNEAQSSNKIVSLTLGSDGVATESVRVPPGGVEPGRHQDDVGTKLPRHGNHHTPECSQVLWISIT